MEKKDYNIHNDNDQEIVMRAINDAHFASSNEFIDWLAETEEHKKLYQDFMFYRQSRLYTQNSENDTEKAWNAFISDKTAKNETAETMDMDTHWHRIIKIAISAAAVLAFGFLLLHQSKTEKVFMENLSALQENITSSDSPSISKEKVLAAESAINRNKEENLKAYIEEYQEMIDNGTIRTEMEVVESKQGEPKHIVLEDGTEIWVNAGSHITFMKHFGQGPRIVDLKGEAYFKVKHDANRPFVVRTAYFNTVDKGTAFNVKAYNRKTASVTLCEGDVEVSLPEANSGISLVPGEKLTCGLNNQLLVNKVNVSTMTAWMHGQFNYEGATLEEIIDDISRHYGKKIVVKDQDVLSAKLKFWASYDEDFMDVMNTLIFTSGIDITMVDGSDCIYIVKHKD